MNRLEFETNFRVMPWHCNDQILKKQLIFGGAFFSQLDLAAYGAANKLLQNSDSVCDTAVTFVWDGKFLAPSYLGDHIDLYATIIALGVNSIDVNVKAYRLPHSVKNPKPIKVAEGKFVFVSMKGDKFKPHGLKIEDFID